MSACPKCGYDGASPPNARVANGVQEYPVAEHRVARPAVSSVDGVFVSVPSREDAKARGVFGVDLPYEQRQR